MPHRKRSYQLPSRNWKYKFPIHTELTSISSAAVNRSSEKLHLLYFGALGLEVVVVDVGLARRHSQVAAAHHEQGGRLDLTSIPDGRALPQHHQLVRVSRRHRVEIPTAHGGAPITYFTIKVSQVCTVLTSQGCPKCPAWSQYRSPHSWQRLPGTCPGTNIICMWIFYFFVMKKITGYCPLRWVTKKPPWDPPKSTSRFLSKFGMTLSASSTAWSMSLTSLSPTPPINDWTLSSPYPTEPL